MYWYLTRPGDTWLQLRSVVAAQTPKMAKASYNHGDHHLALYRNQLRPHTSQPTGCSAWTPVRKLHFRFVR